MIAVTIREARARLNDLVDQALAGEEVVILRGSTHVATLTPITSADLELTARLTDEQAKTVWDGIARERAEGRLAVFESAEDAVEALRRRPRAKKPSRRSAAPRGRRPR